MTERKYVNVTCRAYRDYFSTRITITELYQRIWNAWVKFRGGRKWINSLTGEKILEERRKVKKGVDEFIREWVF